MYSKTHLHILAFTFKWLLLAGLVGILSGSASAFFLISLDLVSNYRETNFWVYYFLPVIGLTIGFLYYYLGKSVEKGNNQIIDEITRPQKRIPWHMAPLVLIGTLLTHLGGGSAGREGTAVQMGGSLADQLNHIFPFKASDRKILLICGISAGFASVFGTPLAGTVFALEVYIIGRMRYEALIPSLFAAIIADLICKMWGATHLNYTIRSVTEISFQNLLLALLAGVIFAFAGWLFNKSIPFLKGFFDKISYPPLRPFIGGLIILALLFAFDDFRLAGLGISTIVESFTVQQPSYLFLFKIVLTAITLSSGFKGGEVTPLFFIGATLGSALSFILPLPTDLLTAMGFVAVFAAAANTPLACVFMGIELFGSESGLFIAIACLIAYLFSGHSGIYSSQIIGSPKHLIWTRHKGKNLKEIK
ncbi:voltage-gated chloride channel family protein [Pedobacter sp. P351]|uniref:voltage-gated chloride channel family protein n=1 Tax=Pedobacter superstes TaxID=3133441 RepID=UPI0030B2AA29